MRWVLLATLVLAACKEDVADLPAPVAITAESAGFYCQMSLLEHDGPKGQVHLDGMPAPLFFSQVRDAVAYLHMPEQSHAVRVTYVQDMTGATWAEPGPWIRAEAALYVIGSDRVGGMGGAELVPFASAEAAGDFAAQHGGRVRSFVEIRAADVLEASERPASEHDDMGARLSRLSGG
ncbi:nitrous oxide reductase accessory protein NosL [Sagittula sp. S175]|uniref:nitrous oxide reductase accessory protein NosL n=1 Tax=Sagittula sp. S175 TaxID=3415129 RepID=UPI003C7DBDD9